jgi:hypothetical protein
MNTVPTLPTAPLDHPSMGYAFLRQEGIRHLEGMAGQLWTDFNVHDPGITILEQVCYAITDLGYRIAYDLPDLLAGDSEGLSRSLFSPAQILPSHPVTLTDLRKLVLDVDGVKNAWIEPVTEPNLPLYFAAGDKELRLQGEERTASPVALKGLYRVLIETSDLSGIPGTVVHREVTRRLHAHRNLCEDFAEIRLLNAQRIQVKAYIEIEPVEDVERLWLDIYQRIAGYISPTVRFYTLSELLAAGKPIDEIFEGPLLEHGFIDSAELAQTHTRRTALRTSDLIREIMDVAGVRAVRTISLAADNGEPQPWSLPLDPDKVPALDVQASHMRLERNRLTVHVDAPMERNRLTVHVDAPNVVATYAQRLAHTLAVHARMRAERDLPPPAGRDRHISTYYALQHQFPAAYGIGEMGLPASATPQRQAQAKQLKAYLMFFDQLLANYFAQLAHVKELFAFSGNAAHTYVAHMIDDPTLGVDEIRVQNPATHRTTLQKLTEDEPTALRRRHRFLNHLLARFAEQFTDYALVLYGMSQEDSAVAKKLVQDKQTFLQRYPHISRARGTGFNFLLPWSPTNSSGLEQRIRLKLGIAEQDEEAFYLVEHILLRPMEDDKSQQIPLLAQARHKDPYSLQLSFVFPNYPPRFQDPHFKTFIEQTVREETPAHLIPYMHWLDEGAMTTFVTAYTNWLDTRRHYWTEKLGV